MGTTYTINIISSKIDSSSIRDSIDMILYNINNNMSTYIDTSTISKLNSLDIGDSILVDSDFLFILNKSKFFNNLTNGAFDITVKPLLELWGFGSLQSQTSIPSISKINKTLKLLGIEKLRTKNNNIIKNNIISIDFSAIAKGFAVDEISNFLINKNLRNHMVEIGGEIKVSGNNLKLNKWSIGVQNPNFDTSTPFKILSLTNKAMATSGNYRNYFELDGKRYSHIISPTTGYPVENKISSVTIISNSCLDSDALSTALMVMSTDDGVRLIEELSDVEVFYILENNSYIYSSGFKNFIE